MFQDILLLGFFRLVLQSWCSQEGPTLLKKSKKISIVSNRQVRLEWG